MGKLIDFPNDGTKAAKTVAGMFTPEELAEIRQDLMGGDEAVSAPEGAENVSDPEEA
jgi:hypothetical protein